MIIKNKLKSVWARYVKESNGNVAMMFAIFMVVLILSISVSFDVSNAVSKKGNAQDNLDAAVLAASKLVFMENGTEKDAQALIDGMLAPLLSKGLKCKPLQILNKELSINCRGQSKSIFPSLSGKDELPYGIHSSGTSGIPNIELSFVYDISNSMTKSQLKALERSLEDLIANKVFAYNDDSAVFSLIPFANTVAFDLSYDKWLDPFNGLDITPNFVGCFTRATTDITVPFTASEIAAPKDIQTKSKLQEACPSQANAARFFNKTKAPIQSMIKGITTTHGTGTSDALTWGYRSLHPEMRGVLTDSPIFPRDFSENNRKILVLLTDGKPFNRSWTKAEKKNSKKPGDAGFEEFVKTCNYIKSQGEAIDIWVVALGNFINGSGYDLRGAFTDCTSGNGQFIEADKKTLSASISSALNIEDSVRLTN